MSKFDEMMAVASKASRAGNAHSSGGGSSRSKFDEIMATINGTSNPTQPPEGGAGKLAQLNKARKSREDEIYDALTAGSKKRTPKSTPERDKLVNDLQDLRNSKGFVIDDLSLANYEQTERKLLADLAAWDVTLGNAPQDYGDKEAERNDRLRVANTWGASASSGVGGISNALATVLDAENARRSRNVDHILQSAIQGSDYATQVGQGGVDKFLATAPRNEEAFRVASPETIKGMQDFADVAQEDSARFLATAKDGLDRKGQIAVDVGKGLFDVAGDTALNFIAPGAGMARMGTSAFGSAAQEARQRGEDVEHQVLAGAKTAAIEVLTEKIGGPFEKAYGKSFLGDATSKFVKKLGKDSAFKNFLLHSGANFLQEGGEEVVSNILGTLTDRIIEKADAGYYAKLAQVDRLIFQIEQAREAGLPTADLEQQLQQAEAERRALAAGLEDKLSKYDLGEMLYEGFVGGLTGLVGGSAESVGKTRASVAEYRAAEQEANRQATGQGALLEEIGIEEPYAEQPAAQPWPNGQDALLEAAGFAQQTQAAESPVSAQGAPRDIPAPPNDSESDVGTPGALNSENKTSGKKQESEKKEKVTVGERYAEDIKYLLELFEDSPVEMAKFARGQGRYGEYSVFDRAGILNEIEGSDRYYVSDGEVARDRTPTSKRADSPDAKTLPSNFRAPKKSAVNKPSNVPPPTPASRQIDSPNDIVTGMGVVHKSGKTGEVALIDGDKVYVQLSGEKDAIAYSKSKFGDFFRARENKSGGASKVTSAAFGNKSFDSDVEQSFNERDRGVDDLERLDRQREEGRYQELRYSDKHGFDNAKGWDAERKASAEEPVAKYDPAKDLGEELYGKVAESAAKLRKASEKSDGDSDGFKKVSGAIDALDGFVNGESSFSDFVDAYMEDEDSPFYEKTVADAMKRAEKAIGSGELSREARDFVERSIRLFEHRVQYDEKVGNVEREHLVSEIRNDKKARIGIPKVISDIAGHYKAMQLRPDVMFKQLGNFKKDSQMYRLADEHLQAIKNKQNFKQEALDHFTEATKMKGYEDFARGKTKIRNPIPGFADSEISLNTALGLLKVLETDGAIEHIVKNGAEFAVNERELYKGINNNGFSDTAKYGQHLSLVSEETLNRHKKALAAAKKAHDSKAFAHADSILSVEIERLRDKLKAEILANPVSKAAYYASIRSVKHISKPMNDASQVMWGEDVATEGDNYYPLEIAGEGRNRELLNDRVSGLKNKGIIQERTGPTGALRIRPFTDTMSRYIDEATDWAAFSVLSDRLELMSRNGWGDTLAGAVGNEYGKYYADWLDNYAKDLNGTREGDVRGTWLRGNLASAALTLNAGVALKQTPSYFDAAGEIDMDILLSHAPGLLMSGKYRESNPLVQEVEQRTRMLASRREGGNVMGEATESARSLGGRVNRLLPSWATNWITQMDVRTTSNLMLACADQVSRDNPDIKQGSEEYYRAVADKFEDVILKTQPVYTKQARADYMRAPNDVIRTLAMFRTQQTQNFNQLVLAIGEYQNATASEKASAKRHLDQVLAGQAAASIMFGVLSAVARASLHKLDDFEDEEGNLNKEQIAKRIGLNSLGAMAGTVWFGGDVLNNAIDITSGLVAFAHNKRYEKEIAAGEVKKRKGTSESNDFGDSVLSMVNDLLSYSRKFAGSPSVKNFASVMFGASQMLGIPLKNAYNLTNSATLFAFDVDRKLSGGGIMNDGSYDDLLKMWNDYKGLTSKKRAEKTLDAAIRARTAGNEQKFDTLMSTLDYEDADVAKAISNAAKLRYGLGEISEEEYADVLKKYGGKSAEEAEKKVEEQKSKNELDAMMQDSKVAELDKKISDAKDRADEYDSSRDYAAANLIIGALLSDADTDKLINAKTSKTYRETYSAIRKTGQSPKEAHETYRAVDNDSNGSLKQAEIYAYYKDNPGMEYIMRQIWASRGWKTSWSDYKAKQK